MDGRNCGEVQIRRFGRQRMRQGQIENQQSRERRRQWSHHGWAGEGRTGGGGGAHFGQVLIATRIWVSVNARMSGEFVGPRESLVAAWKRARMRFLSCVGPNVAGLVLEAMEGLVAHGTFIWSCSRVLAFGLSFGRHHDVRRRANANSREFHSEIELLRYGVCFWRAGRQKVWGKEKKLLQNPE